MLQASGSLIFATNLLTITHETIWLTKYDYS